MGSPDHCYGSGEKNQLEAWERPLTLPAPFPWLGGKYHLTNRLLKLLPAHRGYCEVFGGAASLLLAKEPSEIECYNDLNGDLVNLFLTLRDHPIQLMERIYLLPYSRELFEEWSKQVLKTDEPPDRIERAARFYFCICSGFAGGGPGAGWAFERSCIRNRPLTWWNKATRIPVIHERLRRVHIDHLDFRRFIKNWDAPDNFFFLDPPYFETADYKGVPDFTEKDQRDLAELCRTMQGKWLMTIGDHLLIRELYAAFHTELVETQLAVEKVEGGGTRGVLKHLIITNYDPMKMQAFAPLRQTVLSEADLN